MARPRGLTRCAALVGILALTLPLLACNSASVPAPEGYDSEFDNYLNKPHYKAFVVTETATRDAASAEQSQPAKGKVSASGSGTSGPSFGRAWGQSTVERAIAAALDNCQRAQKLFDIQLECRIHSLGDIDVSGLRDEGVQRAIEVYRGNVFATREDL